MSERNNVHGDVAGSPSMQQSLAVEINPMNHTTTNGPASCENDIRFRHGSLLPKTMNPRPSRAFIGLFVMILALVTNPHHDQTPNKAPYLLAYQ
jgi:hypothetical protein